MKPTRRIEHMSGLQKAKLWSLVDRNGPGGCWSLRRKLSESGYALFTANGVTAYAHRTVYELVKGRIPDGRELDHVCRNRWCVNPDHLEPVQPRENIMRGEGICARNSWKTHCANGHLLTVDNVIVKSKNNGRNLSRQCRTCRLAQDASYRERRRQYGRL
jgi:hypothetical protein